MRGRTASTTALAWGIIASHGEQHAVKARESFRLLRRQEPAQVPQVGNAQAAVSEDADGVHAPEAAIRPVVGNGEGLRLIGGNPTDMSQAHRPGEVVVVVLVAAEGLLHLHTEGRKSRHHAVGVGVQHRPPLAEVQAEASVAEIMDRDPLHLRAPFRRFQE